MDRLVHDAAVPGSLPPRTVGSRERHGVFYTSVRWSAPEVRQLVARLARDGARQHRQLATPSLRQAWASTVTAFLDPTSFERRALDVSLPRLCGLSPAGTDAALSTVLGGVTGPAVDEIFDAAHDHGDGGGLVTIILASNLPALVVQPLLPALALRRPVLVKSPSAEPLFAPAFVRALVEREPRLADAVAAITWRGGDRDLEDPILAASETVVAYGDDETLADLGRRVAGRLVGYGPKVSLAVVSAEVAPEQVTRELARDIALFDQRGCLSPQAVYTTGPAEPLAAALAGALAALERDLPAGPVPAEQLAAVQQVRAEADLHGHFRPELRPESGTVVVDPLPAFRPGPGLRTVRIHPLVELTDVLEHLEPWRGRLQGVALAGRAWELATGLGELGVTRRAAPGSLQRPDARWHNGGRHPVELLAGPSRDRSRVRPG